MNHDEWEAAHGARYRELLAQLGEMLRGPRIEVQYGVIRDMRERGLGLRLEHTTTDLKVARTRAAQLEQQGMKVLIQQRPVITGSWERLAELATEEAAL